MNSNDAERPPPSASSIVPATSAVSADVGRAHEAELLARLAAGDTAAFDEIFRATYPQLVRNVYRMVRDEAAAEDIAQEAMIELWRHRDRLAPGSSFRAYASQVARNRALNHLRHDRVAQQAAVHIAAGFKSPPQADSLLEQSELERALQEAVESLSPRCRQVFEMSRMRGLTYAEIATALGITVKAVEAQMGKALRILREKLYPDAEGAGGTE